MWIEIAVAFITFIVLYTLTRNMILSLILIGLIVLTYYAIIYYRSSRKIEETTKTSEIKQSVIHQIEHELKLDEFELSVFQGPVLEELRNSGVTSETRILRKLDSTTAKELAYKAQHFYIGEYFPKRQGKQDDFSKLILWFKDINNLSDKAKRDLVNYFVDELVDIIANNLIKPDVVIPVPSSKAYRISEGLKLLAKELSIRLNAKNYTGALERIFTVRKSSTSVSSERPTFEEHYNSFEVNPRFDVAGKKVLLIDDVYTLGNTSRAAAAKLFEAGASEVWILTLAKTKRW